MAHSTAPLATDKMNLEEDLQLISNLVSDEQVKVFGSKQDYDALDTIITNWSRSNQIKKGKIVPFKKIRQTLKQIQK